MHLNQLSKLPINAKVGVVGGGVSGLFFTYYLSKLRPDIHISVIDQNQGRPGGWINSWKTVDQQGKPLMLERGPRTLRGISDGTVLMIDALNELGESDKMRCIEKTAEANRKFLLGLDNQLVQVPDSWSSFSKFYKNPISNGLTKSLLLEWSRKPKKDNKDETVEELIRRRFGSDNMGNNIMSAIYHGIYADNISTLSAQKVATKLYHDEREYGSSLKASLHKWWKNMGSNKFTASKLSPILQLYQSNFKKDTNTLVQLSKRLKEYPMLGFQGGLSVLPISIANALKNTPNVSFLNEKAIELTYKNRKLQLELSNENVITRKYFDHVRFSSTPNYIQNVINNNVNPILNDKLQGIKYNTVLLINFYLPGKDIIEDKYHSFGYLVPKSNSNPEKLLGVIFDSVIESSFKPLFPTKRLRNESHEKYTKLTAMVGGHLFNDNNGNPIIPDKNEAIGQVKKALKKHLNLSEDDLNAGMWVYTMAKDCLPRFSVGYQELAKDIEQYTLDCYDKRVSFGGMAFSRGPGVPDVVTDAMTDAIKLK